MKPNFHCINMLPFIEIVLHDENFFLLYYFLEKI